MQETSLRLLLWSRHYDVMIFFVSLTQRRPVLFCYPLNEEKIFPFLYGAATALKFAGLEYSYYLPLQWIFAEFPWSLNPFFDHPEFWTRFSIEHVNGFLSVGFILRVWQLREWHKVKKQTKNKLQQVGGVCRQKV